MKKRGTCPVCRHTFCLNKNGVVAHHGGVRKGSHCAGSGRTVDGPLSPLEVLGRIVRSWDAAKKEVNGFERMTHSADFWDLIGQARTLLEAKGKS